MVVELAQHSVYWLNAFLYKYGISNTQGPVSIIVGHASEYTKHCSLGFGTYFQVHNDDTSNTMTSRTVGAITLATHKEGTIS